MPDPRSIDEYLRNPGSELAFQRLLDNLGGNTETWSEVFNLAAGSGSTTRTYNAPDSGTRVVLDGVSLFVATGALTADANIDIRHAAEPRDNAGASATPRDPVTERRLVIGNGTSQGGFVSYSAQVYGAYYPPPGRHINILFGAPVGGDFRISVWGHYEKRPRWT